MPRRILKGVGLALGGVAGLVLLAAAAVYGFSEARMRKQYAVTPPVIAITEDSATLSRGAHLVNSVGGCVECHGENLAGSKVIDDPAIARVYGANLTSGRGGIGRLSDEQYVRAIRHGIGRSGTPLRVMPSIDYINLSEPDLAAIIAYVRTRPPVDNEVPAVRVGPVGRALLMAGKLPILHAERIDHAARSPSPVPGATAQYGEYLAKVGCAGCHGETLAGGPIVGGAPDWPPAANLTPSGNLKTWSEGDFRRLLREGRRPDGSSVNPVMPWRLTRNLTDEETSALWQYLRTLPAAPVAVAAR